MSTKTPPFLTALAVFLLNAPLRAQVPNLLNHQGRVAVNGVNFDGTGQFKFAFVNAAGSVTYWSNDGTGTAGGQPTAAVTLPVTKGLYSVLLGDTSLTNMSAVPASVFANADLRLRVWFNNGVLGFQQLSPDQRLAPNGYLPDATVTSAKLAAGATAGAVTVTGTSQAAAANTSYVTTAATDTTFTLPATANVGDTIHISAAGPGGWVVPGGDNFFVWTPRDSARRWAALASSADGTKLLAGTDGGTLYTSTDSGATWTARGLTGSWQSVASSADGTKLVAGGVGGQIYTSSDSGVTWTPRTSGNQLWVSIASSADGTRLVAVAWDDQIYTSSDSGLTWVPRRDAAQWIAVTSSADGSRLYAYWNGGGIAFSDDFGVTWRDQPALNVSLTAAASSADAGRLAVAAYESPLLLSTDGWQTYALRETSRNWSRIVSSSDGSRLVATGYSQRLFASSDFGETWNVWEKNRGWAALACSADGRRLVAAEFEGRIYTAEGVVASGLPGTEGTLQYTGGGQWRPVGVPQGTITSGQLAERVVSREKLTPDIGVWRVGGSSVYRNEGENVGIGNSAPRYPLSFGGNVFDPIKLALYDAGTGAPMGLGASSIKFRLHLNASSSRFAFINSAAETGTEVMSIKGTGQVGIGTPVPNYLLSLGGTTANTKLSLYDVGGSNYGLGIGSGQFRLHVDQPSARFSFLDAPAGNEIMTVTGTGQIGIGTTTPGFPLSLGPGIANTKLALWDAGGTPYGLGIGGGQFRLHVDGPGARFSFLDAPAGNEIMTVTGAGQVGIGTANPGARMHLNSTDNPVVLRLQSTGTPGFGRLEFLSNPQGDPNEWRPGYIQSADGGGFTGGLSFVVNGTGFANRLGQVEAMRLQNGRTGMGRVAAVNRLEVEGDASKTTAGAWLANSDRRIKTDIQPVTGALETIEKVKPVTFRYTEEYRKAHPDIKDVTYYNVIAQEFREVFPNAVKSSGEKLADGSEILQVDTYPATITALAAIRELKSENDALKQRLAALEETIRRMQVQH